MNSAASPAPLDWSRQDIRAVAIDLDGTLVDTLNDFVVAINAMLHDVGLEPLESALIEHSVGKGAEALVTETLKAAGGDASLRAAAWASYLQHYERVNGLHSEVYAGVEEGLRLLAARGLALAVLTNKRADFARQLLAVKGLDGYFKVIHGGDSFASKKPDPLSLIETCRALGVEPAQTVMVGDSITDATAARAAGCPVVLLGYGYNHGKPIRTVDADAYLDRLDDLDRLLTAQGR
jgi:phosphoglycolate phosphatase